MSIRSIFLTLATLVVASPIALCAQEPEADFARARQQFIAGQPRAAAQTLVFASAHVRQQVGRSRDADVGARLMEAEGQLDKLASSLQRGTVANVKTLEQSLMQIDRVLAQHHLQIAAALMVRPRMDDLPVVAHDVDRGAFHFERSITLNGGALAAEQSAAVMEARALATEIAGANVLPKRAAEVVATLQRMVVGATTVATSH